ncbi:MAG: hypothetical protein MRK02_07520 [Candidatus Scalindua sp.]|nr:hypothetical protein [Candidatus Scalindua sp.]
MLKKNNGNNLAEKSINGVNVDQFFTTLEQSKEKPEIASFRFRSTNKCVDMVHTIVRLLKI